MTKERIIIIILFGIVALCACLYASKTSDIANLSQDDAETPVGVSQAAQQATVTLSQSQLDEAARQIAEMKNQQPATVTQTVVKKAPVVVERERKKAGADFAIVTDPKNPDKRVDLSQYDQETPIQLNQYNVKAYRKVIRGVTYYPQSATDWQPKEISVDLSRRITDDGQYIGVVVGYDFDRDKAKVGLRFTF